MPACANIGAPALRSGFLDLEGLEGFDYIFGVSTQCEVGIHEGVAYDTRLVDNKARRHGDKPAVIAMALSEIHTEASKQFPIRFRRAKQYAKLKPDRAVHVRENFVC